MLTSNKRHADKERGEREWQMPSAVINRNDFWLPSSSVLLLLISQAMHEGGSEDGQELIMSEFSSFSSAWVLEGYLIIHYTTLNVTINAEFFIVICVCMASTWRVPTHIF